jgi:hypothetical protein
MHLLPDQQFFDHPGVILPHRKRNNLPGWALAREVA